MRERMMSEKLIIVEEAESTATVTLNRQEKRNALSEGLRKELTDTLSRLAGDDNVKAVLLTGRGTVFSAGFDTSEFMGLSSEKMQTLFNASLQYHINVMTFPKPLIAAVNGPALAGGLDLALMCDFRISSDTAFFQHPEIKFGATPLYCLLKPVVGDGLARELSLTGRRIGADEALRIGLVNRVVPVDEVLGEAQLYASQVCESNLETLMAVKKMCIKAADMEEFTSILKTSLDAG
jgi:enoyl-CoA hydratase/carnithine racemase